MKKLMKNSKLITKTDLDKKTLKQIKESLLIRKADILKSLEDLAKKDSHEADNLAAKFPEYGDKADENAQEVSAYGTILGTEKILEKALEDIKSTLKRIDENKYGVCKYCNGEIGKKRLLARPVASSCIRCKTELQEND
jgi:DnaK suppressor protein